MLTVTAVPKQFIICEVRSLITDLIDSLWLDHQHRFVARYFNFKLGRKKVDVLWNIKIKNSFLVDDFISLRKTKEWIGWNSNKNKNDKNTSPNKLRIMILNHIWIPDNIHWNYLLWFHFNLFINFLLHIISFYLFLLMLVISYWTMVIYRLPDTILSIPKILLWLISSESYSKFIYLSQEQWSLSQFLSVHLVELFS